jgi:hypothetical protein
LVRGELPLYKQTKPLFFASAYSNRQFTEQITACTEGSNRLIYQTQDATLDQR